MGIKLEILDKILEFVSQEDLKNAETIPSRDIFLNREANVGGFTYHWYIVFENNRPNYLRIDTENDEIEYVSCNCNKFYRNNTCPHVAAVLLKFQKNLFNIKTDEEIIETSNNIFKKYINDKQKLNIKQEVFIDVLLTSEDNSYYQSSDNYVGLKLGTGKKYLATSKLRAFIDSYLNNKNYNFGKEFEYNPNYNFFSKENEELLGFIASRIHNIKHNGLYLNDIDFKILMNLIKDKPFYYNNLKINAIKESSPFEMNLSKNNNIYTFDIDLKKENIKFITEDGEYIYKDFNIYHLSNKMKNLIKELKTNKLNKLMFEEKTLDNFMKSVMPIVKNDIKIDETIDNIIICNTPDVKLYFDLNRNNIVAKIKLTYNEQEIDYFDKINNIYRDEEYENDITQDLQKQNFIIEKNKIFIEDLEHIGSFLENGLQELSEKYEIYTSENFKKINLNKNNKVTSTFSIGQDNIMHYEFKIDNINDDEIDKILKSMKNKKKYFRLKSGDLLSLENEDLKQLQELTDDLNLSYKELLETGGKIPKYYALYLDSLKTNKYNIIKTNNTFDNFIKEFKKYQNVELNFTKEEEKILRDYQKDGVKWLYQIHKCGFGGILADEMGLGKSLQTICYIRKVLQDDKNAKFLIVVPTSLVYNWKNEFNKFGKDISIELINGLKEKRLTKLEEFNKSVYITTYGLLREDIDYYKNKIFNTCIIDEAQNIKNPKTGITKAVKEINSNTNIALTGTPVENSIIELWSIFDYLMPGFLSSLVNFQGKYKINDFDDDTNNILDKLNKQIKPFILRRKKKDVIKDLPDKIENNIYIDLSDKEMSLYIAEVKKTRKLMDELDFNKSRFEILKLLTRLRQISIDPRLVYENITEPSSKIENLIKVLKEVIINGHKVLLFTSFKTALDLVRKELNNNNITNYTIDGSVPSKKRMELVDKFNEDDTNVFLITLKSGGTGLNLTSADIVIHLDLWWNPQAENQATDRTHRIGQTKVVEVLKLIAKGTIDEKILQLQEKKKILSDKLIETDDIDTQILNKLTEEDIKNLLSFENNNE